MREGRKDLEKEKSASGTEMIEEIRVKEENPVSGAKTIEGISMKEEEKAEAGL